MVLVDSKIHLTQPMQTQTKILEQKICTTQIINGNTSLNLSPAMVEKVSCRKAMIVMKELGISITGIANFLNCSRFTVYRWIKRHKKTGFLDLPRSGGEVIYCEEAHLRIISFYCQKQPLPSCGRWTLRWAALHLKKNPMELNLTPSKSTIHRVLKKIASNHTNPNIFFIQQTLIFFLKWIISWSCIIIHQSFFFSLMSVLEFRLLRDLHLIYEQKT